jgi:hypothetical protein
MGPAPTGSERAWGRNDVATMIPLADLVHASRRTHAIVDARPARSRYAWPLDSGAFDVVPLTVEPTAAEVAGACAAVASRSAVVVDERPERAESVRAQLAAAGVAAQTLAGGLLGWTQLVVVERCESYEHADVVVLMRPSRNHRSYVVASPEGVAIIDASGSPDLLVGEALRLRDIPSAVFDTAFHRDRISAGPMCAVRSEARYYIPPAGEEHLGTPRHERLLAPREIAGLVVAPTSDGANLRLDGKGFSIGAHVDATYRTCCGPQTRGSRTYDAVNRGIDLVEERMRWQLEFGPPGCLPV